MFFSGCPGEFATIMRKNEVLVENISMVFSTNRIFTKSIGIEIKPNDIIIRKSTGEKFCVVNPHMFQALGNMPAHYQIEFSRNLQHSNDDKQFNNYITANNSNINLGVMIDSRQTIGNKSIDFGEVEKLLEIISTNIKNTGLSVVEQQKLANDIEEIRIAITNKDSNTVLQLLNVIKNLCFNVAGNLVASGIVQQLSALLP